MFFEQITDEQPFIQLQKKSQERSASALIGTYFQEVAANMIACLYPINGFKHHSIFLIKPASDILDRIEVPIGQWHRAAS
jgi:hypothetical protein